MWRKFEKEGWRKACDKPIQDKCGFKKVFWQNITLKCAIWSTPRKTKIQRYILVGCNPGNYSLAKYGKAYWGMKVPCDPHVEKKWGLYILDKPIKYRVSLCVECICQCKFKSIFWKVSNTGKYRVTHSVAEKCGIQSISGRL